MSNSTNQWKLGLFVVMGVVATAAAILYFGGRSLRKEAVPYTTYFDESVQGLDVGSPVKFRGVTIGSVSSIDLAGDRRHVEVTYELGVKVLHSLGLAVEDLEGTATKLVIPDDLRVQLASSGITGVKFIQMDFFDVAANPPLELPFAAKPNSIPAAASMMKSLETSVMQAVEKFPELAQQLVMILTQINALVGALESGELIKKIADTVLLVNQVLRQVSETLAQADVGRLAQEIQKLIVKVGGEKGLVSSLQNTSDSLGSVAKNADHVGPAAEEALREVQAAAQSVQRLADALDLDPDMLIKGRVRKVKQ